MKHYIARELGVRSLNSLLIFTSTTNTNLAKYRNPGECSVLLSICRYVIFWFSVLVSVCRYAVASFPTMFNSLYCRRRLNAFQFVCFQVFFWKHAKISGRLLGGISSVKMSKGWSCVWALRPLVQNDLLLTSSLHLLVILLRLQNQ